MNIAFLIGTPIISGGTYVIFQHALYALRDGYRVSVITEEAVVLEQIGWHPQASSLNWISIDEAEDIFFDVVIATWWMTVFNIHRINAKKYVYFVQSIESRFYSESEKPLQVLAESTYSLPLQFVTEANWIKNYLKTEHCMNADVVLNGIRKDLYNTAGTAHAERRKGNLRVLVEGSIDVPFKNVPKTISICRKSEADEVWLLTPSLVSSHPGVSRVFSRIPISDVAPVYRSCDVIVKLSYVEGMFGPPLEMFHCGGTAITYDVSGSEEYLKHEYNALVAPTGDEDQVLSFIRRLKRDPDLLEHLKVGGIRTAARWPDWDSSSRMFWKAIDSMKFSDNGAREHLEKLNNLHLKFFECADNYRRIARDGASINRIKLFLKNHLPALPHTLRFLTKFLFKKNLV